MPVSTEDQAFVEYLLELMQSVGPVRARRMFGGHGIFLDGLMFALVSDRTLYLKVDHDTEGLFRAAGLAPFRYARRGRMAQLSYFQAPEDALEDPQVMALWANRAYAAALRKARGGRGD